MALKTATIEDVWTAAEELKDTYVACDCRKCGFVNLQYIHSFDSDEDGYVIIITRCDTCEELNAYRHVG